jgi:hypothetical protein
MGSGVAEAAPARMSMERLKPGSGQTKAGEIQNATVIMPRRGDCNLHGTFQNAPAKVGAFSFPLDVATCKRFRGAAVSVRANDGTVYQNGRGVSIGAGAKRP